MFQTSRLLGIVILLVSGAAIAQDYVPDELEGWQQWVLKDREYRDCPFYFDRVPSARRDFVCSWPGRLQLDVTAADARFEQQWTLYGEEQWISLPGSPDHWPDQVAANGRAVEVIEHDGSPSVLLAPGAWRLTGRMSWDKRPSVLQVPQESGLLSLRVDGRAIERPEFNGDGVLLGERETDTREADAVRAVVHRLVVDGVPTELVTRVRLEVSGSVREEAIGPLLPEGFVPLRLMSPIPARFEADGTLHLQVRPGTWEIEMVARGPSALNVVPVPATGINLPPTEIWSFRSNDRLRVTAVEGLAPVDPQQVDVPFDWVTLPAFRVEPNETFSLVERSRGVVSATNELSLRRTMWLDFNGDGYTVQDAISGNMRTDWRLDMARPFTLRARRKSARDARRGRG